MENTEFINNKNKDSLKNLNERYSKWQMKQIDYLTFNINLILTLSLGILIFILNSISTTNSKTTLKTPYFKTFVVVLVLIVSIGVIINILRYLDFKYTKDQIKIRKQILKETSGNEIQKMNTDLNCLKCKTKVLGSLTKCLFFTMALLFLITIWTIVLNI